MNCKKICFFVIIGVCLGNLRVFVKELFWDKKQNIFIRNRTVSDFSTGTNKRIPSFSNNIKASISKKHSSSLSKPLILLWNRRTFKVRIPEHALCGGGCKITKNRKRIKLADAVVFQMKYMYKGSLPPHNNRKKNQVMVWFNRESSWTVKHKYNQTLENITDYFNWTMTYRRDSDVNAMLIPYKAYLFVQSLISKNNANTQHKEKALLDIKKKENSNKAIQNLIASKSKIGVWAASNCVLTKGAKERLKMIRELQKNNIEIDIYGKCGKNRSFFSNKDLYSVLRKYKFYFAFENSFHCKDYVTEKVWFNSFYVGLVPVVWGPAKEDVKQLLPRNSYIFYNDFPSAFNLAQYLLYLHSNNTAYSEYFKWRTNSMFSYPLYDVSSKDELLQSHNNMVNGFCNLCKRLNDKVNFKTNQTVPSLRKYWYNQERKECLY